MYELSKKYNLHTRTLCLFKVIFNRYLSHYFGKYLVPVGYDEEVADSEKDSKADSKKENAAPVQGLQEKEELN